MPMGKRKKTQAASITFKTRTLVLYYLFFVTEIVSLFCAWLLQAKYLESFTYKIKEMSNFYILRLLLIHSIYNIN